MSHVSVLIGVIFAFGLVSCSHSPQHSGNSGQLISKRQKGVISSQVQACPSTREYITTVEWIVSHEKLELNREQAKEIASEVAQGCQNAADRFARTFSLLSQVGLPNGEAIELGKKLAQKNPEKAEAFFTIFQRSFSRDQLDLSLNHSLELAKKLSTEFKGHSVLARQDFTQTVNFCLKTDGLDLPKPRCAKLGTEIAKLGELRQERFAPAFIQIFSFLQNAGDGPRLITSQALKRAKTIVRQGPQGVANYIQAYRYAAHQEEQKDPRDQAMDFAHQMADLTWTQKTPASEQTGPKRLPASQEKEN